MTKEQKQELQKELVHGGRLEQVAATSSIAIQDWIDLSTGISPFSYPVDSIPQRFFQQLPQPNSRLIQAAQSYYRCEHLMPTAGSQPVIQLLPQLWLKAFNRITRVWMPKVGYKEHQHAWVKSGFEIKHYQELPLAEALAPFDIVVVINPNNPTGALNPRDRLDRLAQRLHELNGWLICDEAFLDTFAEHQQLSMVHQIPAGHVFVLRSVGKFFGLAGIRLGFVCAAQHWLAQISQHLGPWSVNGPAQWIGSQCLANVSWQQQQRRRLQQTSQRLQQLLSKKFERVAGTSLFQTVYTPQAAEYYQRLLEQGIYVRLTDEGDSLRFGLPVDKGAVWQRVESAVEGL